MADKTPKQYIFASDFDQTLTFNDSGYVLAELVGIPTEEFERKSRGMAKLNLVQQGAELAYLLLHDPEFRSRVRKEHLYEAGKQIRLKENIELLYEILNKPIDGHHFDFYVLSAAPVEVIRAALEGIVPGDHIYGTEFRYTAAGGNRQHRARDRGLWQGGQARSVAGGTQDWSGSHYLQRRRQLGSARDAARECARRVHHRGIGSETYFASRQADGDQHQCAGGAGAGAGRSGGLGAIADTEFLRVVRTADPRVGPGAYRLADHASVARELGAGSGGGVRRQVDVAKSATQGRAMTPVPAWCSI